MRVVFTVNLHHKGDKILMATLDDLTAAVTRLSDDVGKLVTVIQNQPATPDFQAQVDQLNAASDQAEAALPPAP